MLDVKQGLIKLGDYGLTRHVGSRSAAEALPRSASFPRLALPAPRAGVTDNVASGAASAAPLELPGRRLSHPSLAGRLIRRLTPLQVGPPPPSGAASPDAPWLPPPTAPPPPRRLRRQMTPCAGSLVTMAPEVYDQTEYDTSADIYSLGRLIQYMKALHWRWRGVAALDALEEACTCEAPDARPSAAAVVATLQAAGRDAVAARARRGCFARLLPRALADVATLPAALLQSAQYALARNAVLRPAWYVTRLGAGRSRARNALQERDEGEGS
jgi:serine/threonine protein kinase